MAIVHEYSNKCWSGCGQGVPLFAADGRVQTSTTGLEINMEASQEFENGAILFSSPTPEHTAKGLHILLHAYTSMFTAALLTRAKEGDQPRCPPTEAWAMKMWHTYTKELTNKKVEKNMLCLKYKMHFVWKYNDDT